MKQGFRLSALLGFLAVMLGAFGAHALEGRLSERALEVWETANRYHFFHTLAIFALQLGASQGLRKTRASLVLWSLGTLLFSGALYTYALTGLKFAAMLAPLGGLTLAAGWLSLLRLGGHERPL